MTRSPDISGTGGDETLPKVTVTISTRKEPLPRRNNYRQGNLTVPFITIQEHRNISNNLPTYSEETLP